MDHLKDTLTKGQESLQNRFPPPLLSLKLKKYYTCFTRVRNFARLCLVSFHSSFRPTFSSGAAFLSLVGWCPRFYWASGPSWSSLRLPQTSQCHRVLQHFGCKPGFESLSSDLLAQSEAAGLSAFHISSSLDGWVMSPSPICMHTWKLSSRRWTFLSLPLGPSCWAHHPSHLSEGPQVVSLCFSLQPCRVCPGSSRT